MVDRFTAVVKDFDPTRHQEALLRKVSDEKGPGWEVESFDPSTSAVTLIRHAAIAETTTAEAGSIEVKFPRSVKPSDGPRQAARLEDANPGYYMTSFEPFLGKATLSRLTDAEARCRGAVAVALGAQPWEVQVKARPDGGFDLGLPNRYQPSKEKNLQEVADSVVGREGWYVRVDAQALTASIIPSDPPTFPDVFPTPMKRLGADMDRTAFGMSLPAPGAEIGSEQRIDWTAAAFVLVGGTPGSGKSVTLNAIIADALAAGSELVVVDDASKAVDFEWCKPYCRTGGWGCDDLGGAVAALGLVREEGARRAARLKELGINNWLDLPRAERFTPILVVVDEVSALLVMDPPMKGIPKDHPLAVEVTERNLARAVLRRFIDKIVSELRFVGVRMVLSTQATNATTGVPPSLRTKIGNTILQGVNPSKSARTQIFADEASVPLVPENVRAAGNRARGVGVAVLEGQQPVVYKSFFASVSAYSTHLEGLGIKRTARPEPTAAQIDQFLPTLDDERAEDSRSGSGPSADRSPISGRTLAEIGAEMGDPAAGWDIDLETGKKLSGHARANAARHAVVQGA